jgi:hypothetical protein
MRSFYPHVGVRLRETMDHDNQWSLTYTDIVDFYSVIIRIVMGHMPIDLIGGYGGYCVVHMFPFTPILL